jgi:hypothetical protein
MLRLPSDELRRDCVLHPFMAALARSHATACFNSARALLSRFLSFFNRCIFVVYIFSFTSKPPLWFRSGTARTLINIVDLASNHPSSAECIGSCLALQQRQTQNGDE